ncbi:hypothetical protein BaRGS_00014827 [Batillaria attramentaria]|uniref:Uncharacterized protein n=1 Tax=Batillaria attramentaria TaxID=370345 RepID=A0ABD0L482_9CAEN
MGTINGLMQPLNTAIARPKQQKPSRRITTRPPYLFGAPSGPTLNWICCGPDHAQLTSLAGLSDQSEKRSSALSQQGVTASDFQSLLACLNPPMRGRRTLSLLSRGAAAHVSRLVSRFIATRQTLALQFQNMRNDLVYYRYRDSVPSHEFNCRFSRATPAATAADHDLVVTDTNAQYTEIAVLYHVAASAVIWITESQWDFHWRANASEDYHPASSSGTSSGDGINLVSQSISHGTSQCVVVTVNARAGSERAVHITAKMKPVSVAFKFSVN